MTDRNKFEEMLERLINEDRDGAEELFHEIVVEKSREIYQRMIESEEEEVDEAEEDDEDELDESADEDEDDLEESEDDDLEESEDDDIDEMFGLDEFAPGDGSDAAMGGMGGGMGGDATDDMMGDIGGDTDAMDGMDGSKPATKADLDDVIDQLKAEFEKMLNGDNADDEEDDMDDMGDMDDMDDMDDEEGDDEEDEDDDSVPSKEAFTYEARKAKTLAKKDEKTPVKKTAGEQMREYVEKVSPAKMGDNGTNAKSIVANKNDMGGTTANILRTDTENSGEANKGHLKGSSLFKGTPKENNAGNVNVPGGKAGKTAFKKSEPGHGAERRGKPETADKGAHSTIRTTVRSK